MIHIHWYKTVRDSWKYIYQECRCGRRRYIDKMPGHGHQPIDEVWLKEGQES